MGYSEHIQGKILFDPMNLTRKHEAHSEWKKSVLALVNEPDFCDYFAWFIKKRYNLKIVEPQRGVHLTIVNDKLSDGINATERKYSRSKKMFDGKVIDIHYDLDIRTDGRYWWFKAISNEAILLRQKIGLKPTGFYGLHLTVGRVEGREHEKLHGQYIHRLIKNYGR
jgi:hypothetical protein